MDMYVQTWIKHFPLVATPHETNPLGTHSNGEILKTKTDFFRSSQPYNLGHIPE